MRFLSSILVRELNSAGGMPMPCNLRRAAVQLQGNFDLQQTVRSSSRHALELPDEFIDWFGVVGTTATATAISRFTEIAVTGIDYVRAMPGSLDMPEELATSTLMALSRGVLPAVK